MKKQTLLFIFCCTCLVACGGKKIVKPAPVPPPVSQPAPESSPSVTTPSASIDKTTTPEATKPGGYYLDDGPGDNPPKNIDSIPNAVPKKEPLHSRTNRPYKALGATYKPMTSYQPYKARGIASWYGKRFHGRKTSNGETYDMYSMTAAHTILPLPSYVKVTNPANGRWVIVRVNDRGPFKHNRIIDLSYAAAYKLGYINKGSTLVEVEAIDPDNASSYQSAEAKTAEIATAEPVPTTTPVEHTLINANALIVNDSADAVSGYFVQAGAFKNEANADSLINKLQGLDIEQNSGINKVYNNGLHRLKIGPYDSKQTADKTAAVIRRQLNIPAITVNQ